MDAVRGKDIRLTDGETVKVTNRWDAEAEARGATVSTSEWATTAGSLSGEALSGSAASVLLAEGGSGTITNTVTLSTGEVLVNQRRITVGGSIP